MLLPKPISPRGRGPPSGESSEALLRCPDDDDEVDDDEGLEGTRRGKRGEAGTDLEEVGSGRARDGESVADNLGR